jgi:thiamine-monophosphate kinase
VGEKSGDRSVADLGEHAFLDALCRRLRERRKREPSERSVLVEPGDDCAVVAASPHPQAFTTDTLVEGVHFRSTWLSPRALGRRATIVNLSDLAAMAATPTAILMALTVPAQTSVASLDEMLDGCADACAEAGAALVGGNLAGGDLLSLTVTAIGEIRGRALERSGARPGDLLVVTGTLGDAAAAVAAWLAGTEPAPALRERWVAPTARIDVARKLAAAGAHAAIDLSDGLRADLGHLCRASGVGAVVEHARLPRSEDVAALDALGSDHALQGGEDYELLVACPPELEPALLELSTACGVPLTVVGRCTEAMDLVLQHADGRLGPLDAVGYDHFSGSRRE